MTCYKRTMLAAAMLVLISLPLALFIYYKVSQIIVRHEMMEKLEHAELQTIELSAADVKWYEEDREIVVKGKLFDVLTQTKIPGTDTIRFTGLFDEAETELEYKAGRLIQEQEKNEGEDKMVEAFWLFNSPIQDVHLLAAMFTEVTKPYFPIIETSVPLVHIAIPAPPPKAFFL